MFCYVTKVVCNIKCLLYNISQPSRWQLKCWVQLRQFFNCPIEEALPPQKWHCHFYCRPHTSSPIPPTSSSKHLHIHHPYSLCVFSWHHLRKVLEPFLHPVLQELLEYQKCWIWPKNRLECCQHRAIDFLLHYSNCAVCRYSGATKGTFIQHCGSSSATWAAGWAGAGAGPLPARAHISCRRWRPRPKTERACAGQRGADQPPQTAGARC